MRRIVIYIAGTKGGVGKSFAAIMLAGAAMDLELPYLVFDTDSENRTVSELLKGNTEFLDELQEHYPLDSVVNCLYSDSPAQVIIVDMKAGTSRSTQEWFSSVPWDIIRKTQVDVYVAGCITSDPDSVRTFIPWLDYFRKIDFPVRYLIFKNEKDGKEFPICTLKLEPAMRKLKLQYTEFRFPAIEQEYINLLNNNNLTLRDHVHGKNDKILPTIMQKSRLRNHYFSMTDQILEFFASRMEASELTGIRAMLVEATRKRIAFRKGELIEESGSEEENNAGTSKKQSKGN